MEWLRASTVAVGTALALMAVTACGSGDQASQSQGDVAAPAAPAGAVENTASDGNRKVPLFHIKFLLDTDQMGPNAEINLDYGGHTMSKKLVSENRQPSFTLFNPSESFNMYVTGDDYRRGKAYYFDWDSGDCKDGPFQFPGTYQVIIGFQMFGWSAKFENPNGQTCDASFKTMSQQGDAGAIFKDLLSDSTEMAAFAAAAYGAGPAAEQTLLEAMQNAGSAGMSGGPELSAQISKNLPEYDDLWNKMEDINAEKAIAEMWNAVKNDAFSNDTVVVFDNILSKP